MLRHLKKKRQENEKARRKNLPNLCTGGMHLQRHSACKNVRDSRTLDNCNLLN